MGTKEKNYYNKTKRTCQAILVLLVEVSGIEPLTSCMPCKRSPSRAIPTRCFGYRDVSAITTKKIIMTGFRESCKFRLQPLLHCCKSTSFCRFLCVCFPKRKESVLVFGGFS